MLAALLATGLAALGLVAFLLHFRAWYQRETRGTGYFGRTSAERRAFKAQVARRSALVAKLARLRARLSPPRALPGIRYRGLAGPPQCRPADFERAVRLRPGQEDVFVATQMKCGTTWMQQIVYEVLARGRGDLGDAGHRHIYALSPWIESSYGVSVEDAPRVGERKQRILKTHLPASLCPYDEQARYVYVTRHPVACFASCVDFVRSLLGPLVPPLPELVALHRRRCWWSLAGHATAGGAGPPCAPTCSSSTTRSCSPTCPPPWTASPPSSTRRFRRRSAAPSPKSGFAFMKAHEERFEMAPPTPFSDPQVSFLKSGRSDRHTDVGPGERARVLAFCRERLRGSPYPAGRYYPDLGA